MARSPWLLVALAPASALLLHVTPAHAGLESCGNIDVRADARCEVVAKGGCTAQCEPVRFEAACAAKLETDCRGTCNAQATVDCSASCKGDCATKCQANPGSLDCNASCKADCSADCSARCASDGNKSECEASCKACCSGNCDASCTGTPPSATCEAKCEASCSGSCKGQANIDCQVTCQSKGYAECKTTLEGGCTAQCEKPEGALFCDGNYVDTGNNLAKCVDALNAILKVKVEANASGECAGNTCTGEANAKVSCATSVSKGSDAGTTLFVGGLGLSLLFGRRRRRI